MRNQLQGLHKTLDPDQQEKLTEAQNIWLKFFRVNCAIVADRYQGGSMQPLQLLACYTKMTEQRTQGLRTMQKVLNKTN
jgi:uncharacterized protein YecT (DUF1311 family)